MSLGLLGKKIGMTTIYAENGRAVGATVIDVSGNQIVQIKNQQGKDGYSSVQVGFGDKKSSRTNKAQAGHFAKWSSNPKYYLHEFRVDSIQDTNVPGAALSPSIFSAGQLIDVIGHSKGKGFQGAMKRHGFSGQPATHGHMMHRRTGSIGCRLTPGLVWKNQKMPGHDGNAKRTVQNLKVLSVQADKGIIIISGAVPGAEGTILVLRKAKKTKT
jgi:large subunit ribosomal protein L3